MSQYIVEFPDALLEAAHELALEHFAGPGGAARIEGKSPPAIIGLYLFDYLATQMAARAERRAAAQAGATARRAVEEAAAGATLTLTPVTP